MIARAKLRPRHLRHLHEVAAPLVTIVVAVRNGAELLRRRVENLLAQETGSAKIEVIIVLNGCTDGSDGVARELASSDPRIRVLTSDGESGKAGALNVAAAAAEGDFLVFTDVRQTFAPDAVRRLLEPFADPSVGAVGGRLVIDRADRSVEGVRSYWKLETQLRRAESRTGSVVGLSGSIYALRRDLFRPLPPNLILDDVLIPMRVALAGMRVVLQESAVAFDTPSATQALEYRRKVRTLAGNLELLRVLPELLIPGRNPLFARFVSHKLLRLVSPFCFLGMLITAGVMAGPLYQAVFWGSLLVYGLGVAGLLLPLPGLSLPSAFVMIHVAIFAAFLRFREDAGSLWAPPPAAPAAAAVPPTRFGAD